MNTLAWQAYHARVIAAEEYVANPTFEMLAHGVFPGIERYESIEAVQQSHIDEVWHTYLHMTAMQRTKMARNFTVQPDDSHPADEQAPVRVVADRSENWERDILFLVWTVVGELHINNFLELLAHDRTITVFWAQDYGIWSDLLRFVGVSGSAEILADTYNTPGTEMMSTDVSTLARLIREVEIEDRVEYDLAGMTPQQTMGGIKNTPCHSFTSKAKE